MGKEIAFVLSDVCDHSKILVPDSGPDYGRTMGFDLVQLRDANWNPSRYWMIDLRLVEEEFAIVERAIMENPQSTFLLRMVDPYWESSMDKINTTIVFRHITTPNVGYVSSYQPEEATILLAEACRAAGKLFICPNAYDKKREVPLDESWFLREPKIAFAGAQRAGLYTYRTFFRRKMRYDWHWWGKVATLPHPGYADIGQKAMHNVKGDDFITWMAKFQMCFLCPGRCHFEFLKYRECANAGCTPVGAVPKTMSDDLAQYIVPLDWSNYSTKRDYLLKMKPEELYDRAKNYRARFARDRDPSLLREKLCAEISQWRNTNHA